MKKIFTVAMALMMGFMFQSASVMAQEGQKGKDQKAKVEKVQDAQAVREAQRKERQEIKKLAQKDLNARVDKTTKKEAKRLAKEGWSVKPGALPLEKQLEKSFLMQYEYDENMYPKYIMGEASSIGENYDAAKTAAMSLAVTNLAGQIQTEVTALVENTVANKQLSAGDAASISETVMSSKNLISQSIGRVITVVECFRVNDKKNTEVLVRVAYNGDMAKEATKRAIRQALEEKGENLHEQLDKILGL